MSKLVKKLEELESRAAKEEEAAFVRREKVADQVAQEKLAQLYGTGRSIRDDGSDKRRRSWKCAECGYINYSSRNACGQCLATKPGLLSKLSADSKRPAISHNQNVRILTIKSRCYRLFRGDPPSGAKAAGSRNKIALNHKAAGSVVGEEGYCGMYDDDGTDDEPSCEAVSRRDAGCGDQGMGNGSVSVRFDSSLQLYFVHLPIPPRYYKFLIGVKGQTLLEMQRLSGATVIVPSITNERDVAAKEAVVIVKGPTESAVTAAQIRIDSIIMQSKSKVEYTHFLSIPLGTVPSIRHAAATLIHDMVTACCDEEAHVEPSLFQAPERLHLTLLMLRLHNQEEIDRCKAIMIDLQDRITSLFSHNDLVTLKGLNIMNDDPSEAHVVYVEIEKDEQYARLAKLIEVINSAFIGAGLALDKDVSHNEKFHATVINSKWRESTAAGGPRLSFDASNVLRLFRNVCLGSHRLLHVELNVLGGHRRFGEGEGYYQSEFSIKFP